MAMSVEFPTDHRSVAACPLSIDRGSPVKLLIRTVNGALDGGSAGLLGAVDGGGGVLGTGVFFLHPAADIIKAAANTVNPH
jgi:hypothetical protein